MKPRLFNDRYIFVPLQDETDTQITQYSGYKTMDEFLRAVQDIYIADNRKILYKVHPRAGCILSDDIKSDSKFIQVTEDVHHYLPYADQVFGLNSTVMIETLLYHSNLVTYGAGIASRHFANDAQRMRFVATMYNRQFKWADLRNANLVRDSYLYKFFE
jgi:capsule polysaccharide export protein KpsC/LpsZ